MKHIRSSLNLLKEASHHLLESAPTHTHAAQHFSTSAPKSHDSSSQETPKNGKRMESRNFVHYCKWHEASAKELLLVEGVDPNYLSEAGTTPILEAAKSGYHELARLILSHKKFKPDLENLAVAMKASPKNGPTNSQIINFVDSKYCPPTQENLDPYLRVIINQEIEGQSFPYSSLRNNIKKPASEETKIHFPLETLAQVMEKTDLLSPQGQDIIAHIDQSFCQPSPGKLPIKKPATPRTELFVTSRDYERPLASPAERGL